MLKHSLTMSSKDWQRVIGSEPDRNSALTYLPIAAVRFADRVDWLVPANAADRKAQQGSSAWLTLARGDNARFLQFCADQFRRGESHRSINGILAIGLAAASGITFGQVYDDHELADLSSVSLVGPCMPRISFPQPGTSKAEFAFDGFLNVGFIGPPQSSLRASLYRASSRIQSITDVAIERQQASDEGEYPLSPIWNLENLLKVRSTDIVVVVSADSAIQFAMAFLASLYLKPLLTVFPVAFGNNTLATEVRLTLPGEGCALCLGLIPHAPDELSAVLKRPPTPWTQTSPLRPHEPKLDLQYESLLAAITTRIMHQFLTQPTFHRTGVRLTRFGNGIAEEIKSPLSARVDCPLCSIAGLGDAGLSRFTAIASALPMLAKKYGSSWNSEAFTQ